MSLITSNSSFQPVALQHHPFCTMDEKPFGVVLGEVTTKVASYIYSRLPSFVLPGTAASSVKECKVPAGTYVESCHQPTIRYLSDEAKCLLRTRCATIYDAMPPLFAEYKFTPGEEVVLENKNGTIVRGMTPKEASEKLGKNFGKLEWLDHELVTSMALFEEVAKIQQEKSKIIGALPKGSIISFDNSQKPIIVSSDNWKNDKTEPFHRLALSTGGIMGLSPSAALLPQVIETLFAHILENMDTTQPVDIAFVLDTTKSMSDDIQHVKNNLQSFLTKLQSKKATARIGFLEYRDQNEHFLNRVISDFTNDLNHISKSVESVDVTGGGDEPEAVYDALLAAKSSLSWDSKAKQVVILIGDAPPHPKTVDGKHDEAEIIKQYTDTGIKIAIYPIVTNS